MTFIDQVINKVGVPAALSRLRYRSAAATPAGPVEPTIPSLASVEYELSQIRIALLGFVDFGEDHVERKLAMAQVGGATGTFNAGLTRRNEILNKLPTEIGYQE